jgi:hypothetical protein
LPTIAQAITNYQTAATPFNAAAAALASDAQQTATDQAALVAAEPAYLQSLVDLDAAVKAAEAAAPTTNTPTS